MRRKITLFCFCFVGLVLQTISMPVFAEDRALIIGVSKYPFLTENGVKANRDLPGPVHDADHMKQFVIKNLKFMDSQVKVLTDDQATRAKILGEFRSWLIEGSKPGDRVLFYFSGHGLTALDKNGDEKIENGKDDGLDEVLAPQDTAGDLAVGELSNVILDDEVNELLAALSGRAVTVITDSCFSGTISRSVSPTHWPAGVKSLSPRGPVSVQISDSQIIANKTAAKLIAVIPSKPQAQGSQAVWTAATAAQLAWDRPDGLGGIFTSAFIEGAQGAADRNKDDQITPAELQEYVLKQSEDYCSTNKECEKFGLTPTLEPSTPIYLTSPLFANSSEPLVEKPTDIADAVFIHDNDFKLSVSVVGGKALHLGDDIKINIESSIAGRLYLFDQSTSGQLQQIFPNERAKAAGKEGVILASTPLRIPDETYQVAFTVDEKGPGVLMAVVAPESLDLDDLINSKTGFDIVANPQDFLAQLAQRLQAPHFDEDLSKPNGRNLWAYDSFEYVVK